MGNVYQKMDPDDRTRLRIIIGNSNSFFTALDRVNVLRTAFAGQSYLESAIMNINHEGTPANVAWATLEHLKWLTNPNSSPVKLYLEAIKDTFNEKDPIQAKLKEELSVIMDKYKF